MLSTLILFGFNKKVYSRVTDTPAIVTQTDRWTDRQTDGQTDRQTDKTD